MALSWEGDANCMGLLCYADGTHISPTAENGMINCFVFYSKKLKLYKTSADHTGILIFCSRLNLSF
jgi:hypothetical protein